MKRVIFALILILLISCQTTHMSDEEYQERLYLIQTAKESSLKLEQENFFNNLEFSTPDSWLYYQEKLPNFNQLVEELNIIAKDIIKANSSNIIDKIFEYLISIDAHDITYEELITLDSMSIRIKDNLNLNDYIFQILYNEKELIYDKCSQIEDLANILKVNLENLSIVDKYIQVPEINMLSIRAITDSYYQLIIEQLSNNEINLRNIKNER